MKKTFTLAITLLVVGLTVVEAQTTTGWPPANILREYGIEGMPQPTGATNVRWRRAEANEGSYMLNNVRSLYIPFSGTNATLTALRELLIKSPKYATMGYENTTDIQRHRIRRTKAGKPA